MLTERRFVFGLVMCVAGLTAVALAQGAADERAVAKVIADRQVAWNTGDAEASSSGSYAGRRSLERAGRLRAGEMPSSSCT